MPVGFSSYADYLEQMERSSALYTRTIREPQRRRGRQVGIKLSTRDYSRLVDAADLFGATPTTLARLLLNRAVTAVLSFEERKAEPTGSPGSRRSGSAT